MSWTSLEVCIDFGYAGFGQPARTKSAVFSSGEAQANQQVEYKAPSDIAILLIECDPAVRDAMCRLLKIEGFRVHHIPVSADQLFGLITRLLKAAQETEQ